MYDIQVADEQSSLPIEAALLVRVARSVLAAEEVAGAELSVALVDDARIWEINRNFLGHDYPTDVISFLLDDGGLHEGVLDEGVIDGSAVADTDSSAEKPPARPRGAGRILSGEIVISTETAVKSAADYRWTARDEVLLYLVHGILHLCGYDDLSPGEQYLMRRREAEVLAEWNLAPHYADCGE